MASGPGLVIDLPEGALVVHDVSAVPARDDARVVLAIHGITANGLAWRPVAAEIARRHGDAVRVLAPDLRGRADSRLVGGPYGLTAHAHDAARIAEVLGCRPVLVGHSMGAYVAALAGARAPERFAGVVLVDGGFAFPAPADLDIDAALQAVIGPAMARLSMTFASEQAYLDFWSEHPALAGALEGAEGAAIREYLLHDLVPTDDGGALRSSCVLDAIRADGADVMANAEVHSAPSTALDHGLPVELIWAHRGLLDEPQGLYDPARIAALKISEAVAVHDVDANHYTVVWQQPGVGVIADAVERLLAP